jgi:hypothetical protein
MATQMVPVRLNSTDTLLGYINAVLASHIKGEGEVVMVEGTEYMFVRREWNSQDEMTIIVKQRS